LFRFCLGCGLGQPKGPPFGGLARRTDGCGVVVEAPWKFQSLQQACPHGQDGASPVSIT
jgi:hypothetical protein